VSDPENPRFWVEKVKTLVARQQTTLHEQWTGLRAQDPKPRTDKNPTPLTALLTSMTLELLWSVYPASKRFLDRR
jgi:hypothetical protein